MLAEYLYVDRRRLDSYVLQFSTGILFEKIANWKVALGLTGPSVEGSQARPPRPFTEHEKIWKLLKRVKPNELHQAFAGESEFVLASLAVRRAFLQRDEKSRSRFPGLALWIAPVSESQPFICLIEDFWGKDENAERWSGNSALLLFMSELDDLERQKLLVLPEEFERQGEVSFKINWESSVDEEAGCKKLLAKALELAGVQNHKDCLISTSSDFTGMKTFTLRAGGLRLAARIDKGEGFESGFPVTVYLERDYQAELRARFVESPFECLSNWGATIGPERRVDTLFRLRHTLIEEDAFGNPPAVIGYPIFVAEHPSPFMKES